MRVSRYIKESVDHQFPDNNATSSAYIGMTLAYSYAYYGMYMKALIGHRHQLIFVTDLSSLICPILDDPTWVDYRSFAAVFMNSRSAVQPTLIKRTLEQLIDNQTLVDANEFYWQFEEIHPWPDGNGRVGSLLWNLLNNTIDDPLHPPTSPLWN